jgi:hypothetical protein
MPRRWRLRFEKEEEVRCATDTDSLLVDVRRQLEAPTPRLYSM